MNKTRHVSLIFSITGLLSGVGFAQTPPSASSAAGDDSLDAIVVTARKRSESVQTVPVSISVIGDEQLTRQQIAELDDLSVTTSSLEFQQSSAAPGGGAVIRGIGTIGFSRGAEAAVGLVVDGVVQGNTNINELFDISRVEVLRGPQGTLFGQSTSAGVINITTQAPEFSGGTSKVSTELSSGGTLGSEIGRQVVRAAINLPISDNQAARISAYGNRTTGVTNNVFTGAKQENDTGGARLRYLAKFGDNVTLNAITDYAKTSAQGGFADYYSTTPGTSLAGYLAGCGVIAGPRNFSSCGESPTRLSDYLTLGQSFQFDIQLGEYTLTSISAYRKQNFGFKADIDGLPDNVSSLNIYSQSVTKQRQITQEVRLTSPADQRLTYTAGVFYSNATAGNPQYSNVVIDLSKVFPGGPTLPTLPTLETERDSTKNISGFGEARFITTDWLTFFAGARINNSKVVGSAVTQYLDGSSPTETQSGEYNNTDVSYRGGFQITPVKDVMIYGSVTKGYKGAQVSALNTKQTAVIAFPEKPLDFELGVKTNLLNDRLAVDLNTFYTRVKDYQAQTCIVDNSAGQLRCSAENVSRVITKGVELDLFGKPVHGLNIDVNLLYNPAKYPNDFRGFGGMQLAFAPEYKATISGEYSRNLFGRGETFLGFNGTYRSSMRLDITRPTPDLVFPSSFVWGGRVGYRVTDSWSVALFGKNLGRKAVPTSLAGGAVTPLTDPIGSAVWSYWGTEARRIVGLQAEKQF